MLLMDAIRLVIFEVTAAIFTMGVFVKSNTKGIRVVARPKSLDKSLRSPGIPPLEDDDDEDDEVVLLEVAVLGVVTVRAHG